MNPIDPEPHMRKMHIMHTMGIFSSPYIECSDEIRVTFAHNNDTAERLIIRVPYYENYKLCGRPAQYAPVSCKLTFDLLTLKVVSESRVTLPTFVVILVFLGLSIVDLGPMYATDRQTSDARHRLIPPTLGDT